MPFGVIGVLLIILLILTAIFGLLAYLFGSLVIPLAIFFFLVCVLMMLVILIQRPKGGGLAGAFGGVGGGQQSAFGAKVGDVLTWVTVGFFVFFLLLAMGLTWEIKAQRSVSDPAVSLAPSSAAGSAAGADSKTPAGAEGGGGVPVNEAVPDASSSGESRTEGP